MSLDEADVYGQTPIFYAVSENRLEIVRKYSTKGMNLISKKE
jgi:ankyrin repeat protein